MAQQQIKPAEAAKRIAGGEQAAAVLGVTPEQVKAFAALAFNQYQQGRFHEAEVLFRGVTALDSTAYYGYAGLGAVELAKNPPDLQAAYASLSKAAELKPDDPTIQANLGEVLLRQGKIEEAKPHLEKSFQLDPDHKDRGANRARALVGGLNMIVKQAERRVQAQLQPLAQAS
jgi:tetratricopeptide (TPR) repeat protein